MQQYISRFLGEIHTSLDAVPWQDIAKVVKILSCAYEQGGRVYLIGNGGSSAIASHWANDLNKTVLGHAGNQNPSRRFQAVALSDNTPVLTAWANDVGYEYVFSEQLKNFIEKKDVLVAISSSGNSPNILAAVALARAYSVPVIGLTGFSGGKLWGLADAPLHVLSHKYTVVESVHETLAHLIVSYFYNWLNDSPEDAIGM